MSADAPCRHTRGGTIAVDATVQVTDGTLCRVLALGWCPECGAIRVADEAWIEPGSAWVTDMLERRAQVAATSTRVLTDDADEQGVRRVH